ncbi:MAG: UDP-N-acetylmuramoyl-tripeptide--D-alanyl-D-alanine ligase [Firmicutes bacterium]|nr:UDP-N-acetylmuramoyl-tripeptide--D-alanyl-D-alanine ligase [Bacillota bacterium]
MKPITVAQIIQWTAGEKLAGSLSAAVQGVSIDSRLIRSGELFIPLRGERVDGHEFAADALARGAAAALVAKDWAETVVNQLPEADLVEGKFSLIAVDDTLSALQALAKGYRSLFFPAVIAITGSTGKTSTKDMTASILRQMGPALKSQGNYNNEIGLPLTLLQLDESHKTAVVEMGMRGLGQIRQLTELARPQVGIITNVGTVHMELLGSQKAIQRAKQELIESMEPGSVAVLNADDPLVKEMAQAGADKKVIYYGWQKVPEDSSSRDNWVTARHVVSRGEDGVNFDLCYRDESVAIELPVPGKYQVSNALAAAAGALAVGATLAQVQTGLAAASLSNMRMELIPWLGGGLVINDAYNANPTSMAAALHTAKEIAGRRRLVLVLGDMLELGDLSREAHREIGQKAALLEPTYLITVGTLAQEYGKGAQAAGLDGARIEYCLDLEDAQEAVLQLARPGDVILVKGSRGLALEHVVESLCARL